MTRIDPMTDAEINELAVDVVTGRVCLPLEEQALECSFGAMIALSAGHIPENVGMIYEYLDRAGPRALNGHPMFLSMRFVPSEDVERLIEACDRKYEALQS